MASNGKSLFQSLKRYIKAPWNYTGPQTSPEYLSAVPKATEYRVFCPATVPDKAIVPTSDPETVYDIKYFSRDQRRNRPPIKRTVLKKADIQKMMAEQTFDVNDFPKPYLTAKVQQSLGVKKEVEIKDRNARGKEPVAVSAVLSELWGSRKRRALILEWSYYLDAFNSYPLHTWLPSVYSGHNN
nr:Villin-1 like [Ipomoea batatas]